jgi:hypothetical protein
MSIVAISCTGCLQWAIGYHIHLMSRRPLNLFPSFRPTNCAVYRDDERLSKGSKRGGSRGKLKGTRSERRVFLELLQFRALGSCAKKKKTLANMDWIFTRISQKKQNRRRLITKSFSDYLLSSTLCLPFQNQVKNCFTQYMFPFMPTAICNVESTRSLDHGS